MKLNDVKHNHSLTDLLKILIFSILMLIPFIDVGIRCAYVVCNKNAYQSYYGETINENSFNQINNDQMQVGEHYYLINAQQAYTINNRVYIYTDYVKNYDNGIEYTNLTSIQLSSGTNTTYIALYNGSTYITAWETINRSYTIEFNFLSQQNINDLSIPLYEKTYNSYSYLDNVFDYSVNKLSQSDLYTWTQQTAIYTGVQTMCTHLGINNSVIPLLLVYWFILTIIYIIIDIVLKLFTMLTHAIGSKTA